MASGEGIKSIIIDNFEQGGFYVDSGSNYSSNTEIRSGQHDIELPYSFARIQKIQLNCPGYLWSFICYNSNGSFKSTSESSGYKESGTEIDLSAYDWISKIKVELRDLNGIEPPASCELIVYYNYITDWLMKDGDYPYIDGLPKEVLEIKQPYPYAIMSQQNGEYPKYKHLNTIPLKSPYPAILFIQKDGDYPYIQGLNLIPLSSPYPVSIMIQGEDMYPKFEKLNLVNAGAFSNSINLNSIKISKSLSYIGRYAFTNSSLTDVKLPEDCSYYSTSFPKDCKVTGGKLIIDS